MRVIIVYKVYVEIARNFVYNNYIGYEINKEYARRQIMKKTEVVTIRINSELKEKIETRASKRKWSVSQTIEQILSNYFINPEEIIKLINDDDAQIEKFKITKKNQEVLYKIDKQYGFENECFENAINYAIAYYEAQWPFIE